MKCSGDRRGGSGDPFTVAHHDGGAFPVGAMGNVRHSFFARTGKTKHVKMAVEAV